MVERHLKHDWRQSSSHSHGEKVSLKLHVWLKCHAHWNAFSFQFLISASFCSFAGLAVGLEVQTLCLQKYEKFLKNECVCIILYTWLIIRTCKSVVSSCNILYLWVGFGSLSCLSSCAASDSLAAAALATSSKRLEEKTWCSAMKLGINN